MSGQNISLAAYLSRRYSGEIQDKFKIRKWSVCDAMKAGLELLMAAPIDLANALVKAQHNVKGPCPPMQSVFSSSFLVESGAIIKPRYDKKTVKAEESPRCPGKKSK